MEITVKVNYKNEKLQKLRQAAGLSQSQLAEAAGVNVRMYQKYEQGDRDISKAQLTTLLRICKALSCKLSDIVTDAETSELLAEYEILAPHIQGAASAAPYFCILEVKT